MKQIPKYVLKLLEDRQKYFAKFSIVNSKLSEYCESIGLDWKSPYYEDACLDSDIRIYCETDCGNSLTKQAILKQFELNKEDKDENSYKDM